MEAEVTDFRHFSSLMDFSIIFSFTFSCIPHILVYFISFSSCSNTASCLFRHLFEIISFAFHYLATSCLETCQTSFCCWSEKTRKPWILLHLLRRVLCLQCGLSWWMFCTHLKRIFILLLLSWLFCQCKLGQAGWPWVTPALARAVLGLTALLCPSGITRLCYLMSRVLKLTASCMLFIFLVVSCRKVNSALVTPSWPEWEVHCQLCWFRLSRSPFRK